MIRTINRNAAASVAMCAALVCGSPALFAQDVATTPTVQPVPVVEAAPAPPTEVAPPTVVRTIPDEMLGQPVTVPVAEKAAPRRAAAAKAAPVRAVAVPEVVAVPATDIVETAPPVVEPAVATVEDTASIASIEQPVAEQPANDVIDDWMLYGGLAAALGLAGLGAGIAARRRRGRISTDSPAVQTAPDYPAAAPRTIQPVFTSQRVPPVTDPLFSHKAVPAPITDPLFSHKTVVPPITDPLFANHPRYAGRSFAFDKRHDWAAPKADERPTVQELEPAE